MQELDRRLGSDEDAKDLPGTLLMQLAKDYVTYLKRKQELEEEKLGQEKVDPLEMIDQPGLGLERRIAILAEYLTDVEDVWRRGSDIMEQLLRDSQGGGDDNGEVS